MASRLTKYRQLPPVPRPQLRPEEGLSLLPVEKGLRSRLLWFRDSVLERPEVEIWATGDWVHERLLGARCRDLNIVLSKYPDQHFSRKILSILRQSPWWIHPWIPPHMPPNEDSGKPVSLGMMYGLNVEVGDMISEKKWTPNLEPRSINGHAAQRIATIDALYYNLDTGHVLDPTGKGIHDMTARLVRTPLEPFKTLVDNPAGVVRLIRLASRPRYRIDPNTEKSMKDPRIRKALEFQVSRHLIGAEVSKMIKQQNPQDAMRLIWELGLYIPIFLMPEFSQEQLRKLKAQLPTQDDAHPWPGSWPMAFRGLYQLLRGKGGAFYKNPYANSGASNNPLNVKPGAFKKPFRRNPGTFTNLLKARLVASSNPLPGNPGVITKPIEENHDFGKLIASEIQEYLWVMAIYAPIAALRGKGLDKIIATITKAIAPSEEIASILRSALENLDSIRATIALTTHQNKPPPKSRIGQAINSWGPTWRIQLVYSYLAELVYMRPADANQPMKGMGKTIFHKYNVFATFVRKNGLENVCSLAPLLDGQDILDIFGLEKGGPYVDRAMSLLLPWQMNHPGKSRTDAADWVRSQMHRFQVPSHKLGESRFREDREIYTGLEKKPENTNEDSVLELLGGYVKFVPAKFPLEAKDDLSTDGASPLEVSSPKPGGDGTTTRV